jgi:hypothetical protein
MFNPFAVHDLPANHKQIEILIESSTIQVDDERRLITVTLAGPATDMGVTSLVKRLGPMRQFTDGYKVLFDAGDIGAVRLTAACVYNLAQMSLHDVNRVAIVVAAGVGYGMARMYEIRANWKVDRVAVFTKMQPALQDLGIAA